MLQTRHCARADCGKEFTEEGFHTTCPRCRKADQRRRERVRKAFETAKIAGPIEHPEEELKWWLPQ